MKEKHLSEKEIHEIVFEQKNLNGLNTHIAHCQECKNNIAAYRLIFAEIQQLPKPSFGFEVQMPFTVLPKQRTISFWYISLFVLLISIFTCLMIVMMSYLTKTHFGAFMSNTRAINWLLFSTAALLLIGLLIDMVVKYERKIKILNQSIMQH